MIDGSADFPVGVGSNRIAVFPRLVDHLIVGDESRYFSFHESGQITKRSYGA